MCRVPLVYEELLAVLKGYEDEGCSFIPMDVEGSRADVFVDLVERGDRMGVDAESVVLGMLGTLEEVAIWPGSQDEDSGPPSYEYAVLLIAGKRSILFRAVS